MVSRAGFLSKIKGGAQYRSRNEQKPTDQRENPKTGRGSIASDLFRSLR